MQVTRRAFLGGVLAVTVFGIRPPVTTSLTFDHLPCIYGDGIHDDLPGLQACFNGEPFRTVCGFAGIAKAGEVAHGRFLLNGDLHVPDSWAVHDNYFNFSNGGALYVHGQDGRHGPNSFSFRFRDPITIKGNEPIDLMAYSDLPDGGYRMGPVEWRPVSVTDVVVHPKFTAPDYPTKRAALLAGTAALSV